MGQTELIEKSDVTISRSACKHQFGFLSQRSKGVAIPEECFTCERMLDCTISKPEDTGPAVEIVEIEPEETEEKKQDPEITQEESEKDVAESIDEPAAKSIEPDPEQIEVVEEVEENVVEEKTKTTVDDTPNFIKEQITKKIGQILKLRIPKLGAKVEATEPVEKTSLRTSTDDLRVESPGTLYNQWSGTVIINKDTLESWGKKVKEVELQTKKGRVTICRAHPVPNLAPDAIQVPSKIKTSLRIEDGAYVKVKPIQK